MTCLELPAITMQLSGKLPCMVKYWRVKLIKLETLASGNFNVRIHQSFSLPKFYFLQYKHPHVLPLLLIGMA